MYLSFHEVCCTLYADECRVSWFIYLRHTPISSFPTIPPFSHSQLPSYRFLTQEELDIEQTRGRLQKRQKLQLPPVMARRKPGGEVISEDPQLDMLIEHKMVFTDVTDGIKDRQR